MPKSRIYKCDPVQQREIASNLTITDIKAIIKKTKFCHRTVSYWCEGVRGNPRIEEAAKFLAEKNKKKFKLFEELILISELRPLR